jgi:UDP-N-acetyl-D-glucosamine dehydrogenase
MTPRVLQERIVKRDYQVGVIGLGYVGLPLALRFAEVGFPVLGVDIDLTKIKQLNDGVSYIRHIPSERISALRESGKFEATVDLQRLGEPDALLICVPTPLGVHREPDLQYIEKTADAIAETLRPGQLVSLESTTFPGTTEEVVLPRLKRRRLDVGRDFFLAFSPEREDPGNDVHCLSRVPKVVSGVTPACRDLAGTLYAQAVEQIVPVASTRVAEATKLLENIYRSINIALVNELKIAFDHMGIDVWQVIEAAKTKPFGFQAFYPGPGLGGHCIPIDPFYLTWKAREHGIATKFIELAGEINSAMPEYVIQKLVSALNEQGKSVKGSTVLILGVGYKKDADDPRESPALEILELLLAKHAVVGYSDPFFPYLPQGRRHRLDLECVPLTEEAIRSYDAVVLVTDHSAFPYELISRNASLIVDSRNAFGSRGLGGVHIVRA